MEEEINKLLHDLANFPDSVILVPAPEPRFVGHMIRVRDCSGPLWLELLRKEEARRVHRWRIEKALITMRDKGYFKRTRYIKLCEKVLSGDIYESLQ